MELCRHLGIRRQQLEEITPEDPEGDGNPSGGALIYDAARGIVVLFGGSSGQPWEYDGTSWTEITPTDPEGDGNPSAGNSPQPHLRCGPWRCGVVWGMMGEWRI